MPVDAERLCLTEQRMLYSQKNVQKKEVRYSREKLKEDIIKRVSYDAGKKCKKLDEYYK